MGYKLAAIGLAPVIIAQGLYVRRVTPRLPEPEGERSGVNGAGPPLSLLILGDSAAAGVGVATQDQALSGQLVSAPWFRFPGVLEACWPKQAIRQNPSLPCSRSQCRKPTMSLLRPSG